MWRLVKVAISLKTADSRLFGLVAGVSSTGIALPLHLYLARLFYYLVRSVQYNITLQLACKNALFVARQMSLPCFLRETQTKHNLTNVPT
jgi:hypothetical protein